jgi:hypothetical protein
MSAEPALNKKEVAFSVALTTSALVILLRSVYLMAEKQKVPIPDAHAKLISVLEHLFEEMASQCGEELASTGHEKTKRILNLVMGLSRPGTVQ